MEIYTGRANGAFLARRGDPSKRLPHPQVGSHPRCVFADLIDEELDNLILGAFDCDGTEDTFCGMLRATMDCVKQDVLTSCCAYRIGFEGSDTELTLLVTVLPGSLTTQEAVEAVMALSAVLEVYDARLSSIAIEVAELMIVPAVSIRTEDDKPDAKDYAEYIKAMSSSESPRPGSSIGLEGDGLGPV